MTQKKPLFPVNRPIIDQYQFLGQKKHKSNIAGRGPDFQDQPKLAAESVNQHL